MYYKSRTDDIATPNPVAPPMGPAGSIVIDPDFGSQIIRATDENTLSIPKGGSVGAGIGGSADVNIWNSNSTLLYLHDFGGGGLILSFNPLTFEVKRVYPKWRVPGALIFSRLDPNVAFNLNGTQYVQYDFSDITTDLPPSPTVVCDFASQLPGTATWRTLGGAEYADKVFTAAFSVNGGQGTGSQACTFTIGQGYRTYNTATGIITGDFGPVGPISIPDRYTIHNVKSSKDGLSLTIGKTTTIAGTGLGPTFWIIDDVVVSAMSNIAQGGHWTDGYGEFLNNSSSKTIPNYSHCRRLLTALNAPSAIAHVVPTPMWGCDDHLSFNGPQNSMFVSITTSNPSPDKPPYPCAWWDEILGFDLDGSGRVYRFAHHFSNTHVKSGTFDESQATGAVDQLNRFVAFTSNWQSTLANGRCDAFIVALH